MGEQGFNFEFVSPCLVEAVTLDDALRLAFAEYDDDSGLIVTDVFGPFEEKPRRIRYITVL